ncbi:MAG: ribosome silencing factor [Planctomycetes bacterium]|nr:ribosome silencing factor [Planctomycetota bacterium]
MLDSNTPDRDEQLLRSRRHACLAARVSEDYRGKSTVVLDLSPVTPIVDFFVITTATSRRQMHAIAEEVDRVLGEEGSKRRGLEGYQHSAWILQDYGDVVLHVFSPETRQLYDLERLWADAPRVDWRNELGLPPASADDGDMDEPDA